MSGEFIASAAALAPSRRRVLWRDRNRAPSLCRRRRTLMFAGLRSRWTMPCVVRGFERLGDLTRDGEGVINIQRAWGPTPTRCRSSAFRRAPPPRLRPDSLGWRPQALSDRARAMISERSSPSTNSMHEGTRCRSVLEAVDMPRCSGDSATRAPALRAWKRASRSASCRERARAGP